jgi:hypothetical protein
MHMQGGMGMGGMGLGGMDGRLPPPLMHQQQQQQHGAGGSAPADAETLRKLKEELMQQKQADGKGGKAGAAGAGASKKVGHEVAVWCWCACFVSCQVLAAAVTACWDQGSCLQLVLFLV